MSEESVQITLGGKPYTLVPQRIGRIQRKLRAVMELFSGSPDVDEVGPRLYEALEVFIPDIEPLWRMQGYPTAAAAEKVKEWRKSENERRKAAAKKWFDGLAKAQREELGGEVPAFELLPLSTQQEFKAEPEPEDVYDDDADASPTTVELIDAIEAIFRIHGGEKLVKLVGKVVSEDALRNVVERQLVLWQSQQAYLRSRSLQLENGASASTPSSPPEQIEPETTSASLPPD